LPKAKASRKTNRIALIAGWSSPVARQAHNLKAAGSNPAPATNIFSNTQSAKPKQPAQAGVWRLAFGQYTAAGHRQYGCRAGSIRKEHLGSARHHIHHAEDVDGSHGPAEVNAGFGDFALAPPVKTPTT
jgi:hypothetical protein